MPGFVIHLGTWPEINATAWMQGDKSKQAQMWSALSAKDLLTFISLLWKKPTRGVEFCWGCEQHKPPCLRERGWAADWPENGRLPVRWAVLLKLPGDLTIHNRMDGVTLGG